VVLGEAELVQLPRENTNRVDLSLLAVALVWGSSYLAAREVATAESVFAFLAIRFALAAAGLAIVLAPRLRYLTREEVVLGVGFGAILSAVLVLETLGVTMTTATNAGLIISLAVVMTPLLDRWVGHTALPPAFYGAAVMAVVGVGMLTQSSGAAAPGRGDLLILFAAAARAVHVTAIARLSAKRSLDSARVTLVQLCTGLVIFLAVSRAGGPGIGEVAAGMSIQSWLITAYLAFICTVFAFVVQTWAVRGASPSRVSLVLSTEPLWAAVIGVGVARDPVTVVGLIGALLILVGAQRGRRLVRQ
jgi:drug/metabolite transporter (DMT)-like permease